jgi:hypothetical protein
VDGLFAVWNVVVTTFSDNDISAHSGWHSADGRSLVPSNPLQNPCREIDPTPHEPPWILSKSVGAKPYSPAKDAYSVLIAMGHSPIQLLAHLWNAATLKCDRQGWMGYGATATRIARELVHRGGRDNSDRADHVLSLTQNGFLGRLV